MWAGVEPVKQVYDKMLDEVVSISDNDYNEIKHSEYWHIRYADMEVEKKWKNNITKEDLE